MWNHAERHMALVYLSMLMVSSNRKWRLLTTDTDKSVSEPICSEMDGCFARVHFDPMSNSSVLSSFRHKKVRCHPQSDHSYYVLNIDHRITNFIEIVWKMHLSVISIKMTVNSMRLEKRSNTQGVNGEKYGSKDRSQRYTLHDVTLTRFVIINQDNLRPTGDIARKPFQSFPTQSSWWC